MNNSSVCKLPHITILPIINNNNKNDTNEKLSLVHPDYFNGFLSKNEKKSILVKIKNIPIITKNNKVFYNMSSNNEDVLFPKIYL